MLRIMDMGTGMFANTQLEEEYGVEVMRGEWHPVLVSLQAAVAEVAREMIQRNALPVDLREADAEAFLRKMYAAQQ
jgi:hypothetical protein